jgi:hypothetical protein
MSLENQEKVENSPLHTTMLSQTRVGQKRSAGDTLFDELEAALGELRTAIEHKRHSWYHQA